MADWYDLDDFKSRTNETNLSDANLRLTLNGVQASIIQFLGYNPVGGTATEYYDGEGTSHFVLRQKYVNSITSLHVNRRGFYGQNAGAFTDDDLLVSGTDYTLEISGPDRTGIVHRIHGYWPFEYDRPIGRLANRLVNCPGCIKVVYNYGDGCGVPPDVLEALYTEAAARSSMWQTGLGAQLSASLDGHSVSMQTVNSGQPIPSPFISPLTSMILSWRRRTPIY